jgi:uncharacterized protein (UPF0548 family)
MKVSIQFPNEPVLAKWLSHRKTDAYSYPEQQATQQEVFPNGYDHDRNKCLLGKGEATFKKAKQAIDQWVMFPAPWTKIYPNTPAQLDEEVVVLFHLFGVWWFNSSRIVYTIDEPNRYGFAYGTLTQHVEKGEEVFLVEKDEEGNVWYRLEAFSQPNRWYVKLAKPLARMHQRRFAKESKAAMQAYCQDN